MPAPGYAYLTLGTARAQVAARLEDPNFVYWTVSELNDLIALAVRTWQALTGTYKQRASFDISSGGGVGGSAFYDLASLPLNHPQLPPVTLLSYFVTDQQLINIILAALLEPPLASGGFGTGQFAFSQITQALQNRINRWITDTGCDMTRNFQHVEAGPSASRVFLPEGVLDVRRAAWASSVTSGPPPLVKPPVAGTVSLLSFGSAGNGGDDTAVFQAALNAAAASGRQLEIPVSAQPYNVQPIYLPTGTVLLVDPGVTVQATSGYTTLQRMININDATSVWITATGSTFKMRKSEYTSGEFRHCLGISGSSNVTIQGATCNDSGGDGIYIAGSLTGGQSYSYNITVQDSTCNNNRRDGMSLISGQSVFFRRCSFTNSNGTPGEDGIDMEPNAPTDRLVDIHIEDCTCSGNNGDGLSVSMGNLTSASQPVSVTVLRHKCSNNGRTGYIADYTSNGNLPGVTGSVVIQDSSSTMDGSYGARAHFYVAAGPSLTFRNLKVTNANQTRTTVNNAAVGVVRGGGGLGLQGNVYFLNPTITDTTGKIDYYYTINDFSNVGEANIQYLNPVQSGARLSTATAWGWIDNVLATSVNIGPNPAPAALVTPNTTVTYSTLFRDDEYAMQAFRFPGALTPAIPQVWGKFVMPPVGIDLYPPPLNAGDVEMLVVQNGPQVGQTPTAVIQTPTILRIPEDFVWGILFGTLSDLLSADGPARDPARALYAESRYQESVELYKMNPVLLATQIEGVGVWTGSVFEMDTFLTSWQASPGVPQFAGMAGRNLVAFAPAPNATYSVTMDVVANIPLPALDSDFIQVDRGALDPLLDYAQHLASFKMAGAEFQATDKLRQNFYVAAALENARITKGSFYRRAFEKPALMQQFEVPRI